MVPVFSSVAVVLELVITASPTSNDVTPTTSIESVEIFLKNERTSILCIRDNKSPGAMDGQ